MIIPIGTWQKLSARRGEMSARDSLRWVSREQKMLAMFNGLARKRDALSLIHELVHEWPGGSPTVNRLKFSGVIRELIRHSREHRGRIMSYCAPGVAQQWLP